MRHLFGMLLVALAGYALYLGLLYGQQRAMMFPGTGMPWNGVGLGLPGAGPAGAQRVDLAASFGTVQAVHLPAAVAGPSAPAAIYFHGNAEFVDQNLHLLQALAAQGVHVLLPEFPGYAGTDGRPTRDSLAEAGRLAYDWLAAREDVDAARIIGIGRSVGSGPATELSAERPLAALVLMAPFTSVADFARRMGAPAFLVRDRFDNRARVAAFEGPVLVMHGRRDGIIPYAHGEAVAQAARRGELVTLGCGHNDCPFLDTEGVARITDFLRGAGLLDAPAGEPL